MGERPQQTDPFITMCLQNGSFNATVTDGSNALSIRVTVSPIGQCFVLAPDGKKWVGLLGAAMAAMNESYGPQIAELHSKFYGGRSQTGSDGLF